MPAWSDDFAEFLHARHGADPDAGALRERYGWTEMLHGRARELLEPASLEAMEAHEVYDRLNALRVPGVQVRLTNLGRENDAEALVRMLRALVESPGGLSTKFRAARVPQTGIVTATTLLCLVRPHRFFIRNAPFTRAAARVIPLYGRKALEELAYGDFLDLLRELARVQEAFFAAAGLGDWAARLRYLLLYAVLTGATP